jgi:hypothetical protein
MTWVVSQIKGVMLVSGLLTCTMLYAAFAPQAALRSTFGESLEGPLAEMIVRNWGVLIALVGAMLVHGAFNPAARPQALVVAGLSKIVFILLVLSHGSQFLDNQAGVSILIDTVMVALFCAYLLGARRSRAAA